MKAIILCVCLALFACSSQPTEQFDLIITNVNLIDGTGNPLQEAVNVYINDSRIVRISKDKVSAEGEFLNGKGKYLIPGLFDGHAHPVPYQQSFPQFAHFGVTAILVTGCSLCTDDYYAEMSAFGAQDTLLSPRVFHTSQHFTMEGRHPIKTYTSSNWIPGKSIHLLEDTLQIKSLIKEVAQNPIVGIKLTIEDGPFPPFVERMPQLFVDKVVKEAKEHDLPVFAHASDNTEFMMALNAGAQNHLHYLAIDLDLEGDKTILNKLLENETSIVTTFMLKKSWLYPLHPEWIKQLETTNVYQDEEISYLSDPARKNKAMAILKGRKYMVNDTIPLLTEMLKNQFADLKMLAANNINIVIGTDTRNEFILPGMSVHEEMQIMELGGFSPLEIIKMATHNPAKMLKQLDKLGTIEEGKLADLILLDKNPLEAIKNTLSINSVIKNGKLQKRLN